MPPFISPPPTDTSLASLPSRPQARPDHRQQPLRVRRRGNQVLPPVRQHAAQLQPGQPQPLLLLPAAQAAPARARLPGHVLRGRGRRQVIIKLLINSDINYVWEY